MLNARFDPHKASHEEMDWRAEHGVSKALPFIAFDDIQVDVQKPWIVKCIIARGETSSWIGGPGKGKSALLTDLAVHIADGRDWRGYRSKERCAVIILVFERADLMLRRLEAYKRKHRLHDLPVVVIRASVDILKPEAVDILTDTVRAVERHFGLPVGMLGLDTYSKAVAIGGGDENSAKDVNRFLGHLRQVQAATRVHVALVGHVGKDENRGHRGSNAALGDIDVEVRISGDQVKAAVIEKANDQPEGPLTTFTLESYDFGLDEDGDAVSTSILSDHTPEPEAKAAPKRELSDRQKIALDALTEALISFGREAPAGFQLPRGIRVVDAGRWREELFARGIIPRDHANPRTAFAQIHTALTARSLIGFRDELVWKV
jgi:hypothetical protein